MGRFSLFSLRGRLLLLVLIGIVPALILLLYTAIEQRDADTADARASLQRIAHSVAARQRQLVEGTHIILRTLAQLPSVRSNRPQDCGAVLAKMLKLYPRYANLGVADRAGNIWCSALPLNKSVNIADREYFRDALRLNKLSIGAYQVGRITGKPAVNLGYPVTDANEQVTAVVYVALDLRWLQRQTTDVTLPEGAALALYDHHHRLLANTAADTTWLDAIAGKESFRARIAQSDEGAIEAASSEGNQLIYAYATLASSDRASPAYVIVGQPKAEIYAHADAALTRNLSIFTLIVVLSLSAAWIGGRVFVLRQIEALLAAMRSVAGGDLSARAEVGSQRGELEELGNGFNEMARTLEHRARQTESHLERIARLNRVYAVLSDINGTIIRVRERTDLLRSVCSVCVNVGGFQAAWIVQGDRLSKNPIMVIMIRGEEVEAPPFELKALAQDVTPLFNPKGFVVFNDMDSDPAPESLRDSAKAKGARAAAVMRLQIGEEVVGMIGLYAEQAGFFDIDERRLLEEVARDIAFGLEHIQRQEQVTHLAYYDMLTDLPNRALFSDRLKQALARAVFHQRHTAVLLVRIEQFKEINSLHGIRTGDRVLVETARRLSALVRTGDTVARIGSSTFGLLLAELAVANDAAIVAEKIVREFSAPTMIDNKELTLTIELGIAVSPVDGHSDEELFRNANAALHLPHARTEQRYRFYTPEINRQAAEQMEIETELRHALERNELSLHYQPIVDLESLTVVGTEALMRWRSERLGAVSPGKFIPIAEKSGLIVPLGDWALRTACRQAARWAKLGQLRRISVNVSVRQLKQPGFLSQIDNTLIETNLGATDVTVVLEITESELLEIAEDSIAMLNEIKSRGLRLAIDDFGTGYSSLSYLQKLPVDLLKIDLSFIKTITRHDDEPEIVKSIIALAGSFGMSTVAEGVETPVQLEVLRRLQCQSAQGFLFSPAVTAPAFEKLCQRSFSPHTDANTN